jgi:TonB-linked SusC/RagA family outer membrane protein
MRNGDARGILQKLLVFIFLTLTATSLLHAQEIKTVSGTVLDDNGNPVSNTSILIKGSKQAVATDSLGKFTIKVKKGDVLQISHVSFSSRKITYDNQGTLRIALQRNDAALSEVVVTGYQNVKKKLFSGSSSTLTAKELERPGTADITKMLEGQFAGVSVQNVSGTFGAAPKLRIRGATSLSGDNKPLWVIDGIIVEDVVNISNEALTTGDMNTLLGSSVAGVNPADIQDITILRDAAATALYGARAMNGVVVVTTKKGKASSSGAPNVSYTGNYSMYIKPRYEDFDILNSADQMGVLVEEMNKGYFQMPGEISGGNGGVLYKMYSLINAYDSTNGTYGLRNDDPSKAAFLQRYADANTNWFDIIFKNSFIQEHSVSISSGTEKFQTYASTSYLKDNGQTLGNSVEKFTGNLRTNFRMGSKVRGELLATGSVRNQRAPGTQNQQSEPVYGSYLRGFDINPYNYALNTSRMVTPYDESGKLEYFTQNYAPFNIINELNTNYMKLGVLDFKVQGGLSYRIIPQLEYSINGSYRYVRSESQTSVLEGSNMAQAYREASSAISIGSNQFLYSDPDHPNNLPYVVLPSGGFYNTQSNNLKYLYFRHSLDFNQTFNDDHTVTAFASMEARSTERQYEFFDGVGYQFDNGGLVSPYYMYFKQAAEQGRPYFGMLPGKDRFLAYMLTATYAYKNKYVFTPTVRFDGSNKMGKSKVARWLPTWNLAGSWNIHEEPFWINNKVLTSATLRSSYGLTGNIGSATNSAATYYNLIARRPYINDQETLTFISDLENSQLTWEKSKDLDVGADLGFLNNRITLKADYYKRRIQDLIGNIKTSGIGGQATKTGNYGTMDANGIEFTLDAKIVKTRDFSWSSRFNIAHNTNKITYLETAPLIWTAVSGNGGAVKGYPSRGLFSVPFAGLDHNLGYPTYIGTGKGMPVTTYIALQDDDLSNLKYEGPVDPTLTGGFYNQVNYKGFTLSGLIKFSSGNVLRLRPTISAAYSDMQAMTKDVQNRWIMPGDETRTSIPSILDPVSAAQIVDNSGAQVNAVYPYNLYNYSTERVVNGKYLKLSNIAFGYQLPQSVCSLLSMTNASITAVANNILTIYADKRLNGQDPEFYNSGGVALPTSKQVTVSLKVGF